jgi:hypothetical protein
MTAVDDFFLNKGEHAENQVVEAPAFSITKVLSAAAIVVTPIATVIVDKIGDLSLTPANYVALALGVLGFLAITTAADVLARAMATAADSRMKFAQATLARLIPFAAPLDGHEIAEGADPSIKILAAAQGDAPYFLVKKEDDSVKWLPESSVRIP